MSSNEPPRKRPRSAISPEERKEARAHQSPNSRRKTIVSVQASQLALPLPPPPHLTSSTNESILVGAQRNSANAKIRSFENAYVLSRKATKPSSVLSQPMASPYPPPTPPSAPHNSTSSDNAASSSTDSSPHSLSWNVKPFCHTIRLFHFLLRPTHSTIADSPITFANDSLDLPFSPAFSPLPSSSSLLDSPKPPLDLSLTNEAPTRHLARVATTANVPAVALQRVGSPRLTTGWTRVTKLPYDMNVAKQSEDEATSDAVIARLLAEIIASPPFAASTLPSVGGASEETRGPPMLNASDYVPSNGSPGLGLGSIGIDDIDWSQQVQADTEMEKLLGMFPVTQDVDIDLSS
ncbi:hypothetical protein F5141DRAFT_1211236 [Pisolithus sp. B1]|nr:hypothetical protein F5141DRAFT_1211236 [Pisolithus sp. B1]